MTGVDAGTWTTVLFALIGTAGLVLWVIYDLLRGDK